MRQSSHLSNAVHQDLSNLLPIYTRFLFAEVGSSAGRKGGAGREIRRQGDILVHALSGDHARLECLTIVRFIVCRLQ